MEWVREFYSTTGRWWGPAESRITDRDHKRAGLIRTLGGADGGRVLELGSAYGNTAAATARAGFEVVGVEISDRITFAQRFVAEEAEEALSFVHGDFYTVELDGQFDVVTYWNGFGVGTDADQRRLLRRIADEWLVPGGRALIDVANPFVWASWAGDTENKKARPQDGYHHDVSERSDFDPVRNRLVDTWWETGTPDVRFTQDIRCYTPADMLLLLEGTGLRLASVHIGDQEVDPTSPQVGQDGLLRDVHEYLAVLAHE